jgi:hypothetical protein
LQRPQDGRDRPRNRKIIHRAKDDLTLVRRGRGEDQLSAAMREQAHEDPVTHARHNRFSVMRPGGRVYEDQVTFLDPAVDHSVVTDPQEKRIIRWNEHPVHRDEAFAILVGQNGFARVEPSVEWNGLRLTDRRKPCEPQAA